MLGELTPELINAVLFNKVVGRIGCYGEGRTCIVPITCVFDGEAVYGHSADGLKIRMILVARLMPLVNSDTLRLPDGPCLPAAKPAIDAPKTILYRIRLIERTGRFEKR